MSTSTARAWRIRRTPESRSVASAGVRHRLSPWRCGRAQTSAAAPAPWRPLLQPAPRHARCCWRQSCWRRRQGRRHGRRATSEAAGRPPAARMGLRAVIGSRSVAVGCWKVVVSALRPPVQQRPRSLGAHQRPPSELSVPNACVMCGARTKGGAKRKPSGSGGCCGCGSVSRLQQCSSPLD